MGNRKVEFEPSETAELLLQLGVDPAIENKKGKTAFEIARKDCKYLKSRPV